MHPSVIIMMTMAFNPPTSIDSIRSSHIRILQPPPPGQEAGGRRQETGGRTQETGVKRQETGDRRQETGDRRQETGDRRQQAGHRTQDTGHRTQDTGHRTQDTGHRRQETGDRRQETGDRRQDTGCRRQETGGTPRGSTRCRGSGEGWSVLREAWGLTCDGSVLGVGVDSQAGVDVAPPLEESGGVKSAGTLGGDCPTTQTDSGDCSIGPGTEWGPTWG